MADTHPFGVERLGDDHVLLVPGGEAADITHVGHAREAATFFVRSCALLDSAAQRDAGAADGLHRVDRGGDARLLVARTAAVDPPIAQFGPKRVDAPARAGRN